MFSRVTVAVSVALSLYMSAGSGPSVEGRLQEGRGDALTVTLEPTDAVFASPNDVELRLAVINRAKPCRPTFIDPVLSPPPGERLHRPFTVLELQFLADDGQRAPRLDQVQPDYTFLLPSELLRIGCDSFYGWYIRPALGPWDYVLQKGKYQVTGTVIFQARTFARERPTFWEGFVQRLGVLPDQDIASWLAEGRYTVNAVTFEVLQEDDN